MAKIMKSILIKNKDIKVFEAIVINLDKATNKHAVFADNYKHALAVVKSEMLEFEAQAILAGYDSKKLDRAKEEALDVIATLVRFINEEWRT